jgi:hypothetical protein
LAEAVVMNPPDANDENGPAPEPSDLGRTVLQEYQTFGVVLINGERWQCRLVACGREELLVTTESGRILLPKHAIVYVILAEDPDAVGHPQGVVQLTEPVDVEDAVHVTPANELPAREPEAPVP